jgi:tRNA-Thr(GGU) m(6)t(6)A37 methyltransferase TsaA
VNYQPIGLLRTPFKPTTEMPIQPTGARGVPGHIELRPELAEGLNDLTGFSHIIVLYHFHRSCKVRLAVTPFLDEYPHGVFATRAPSRPNSIGLSVLRLNGIDGVILEVEDVDMLDETPLLDIKPYVPEFDRPCGVIETGWLKTSGMMVDKVTSDDRFKSQ